MWSNNFPEEDIIGIFNFKHYLIIVVYLLLAVYLAVKLRKMPHLKIKRLLAIVAISLTFAEMVKDADIILHHGHVRSWLQLAYCSLFLPASWMALSKNKLINKLGSAYLVIGGIVGGTLYIFVPNGSITTYPLYHIKAIHAILYHFFMVFLGLLCLCSKYYELKKSDFKYYFIYMSFFTILALGLNELFDCHALFLNDPSGISFLISIYEASPIIYAILVYLFEAVFAFFGVYYGYILVKKVLKYFQLKRQTIEEYN